MSEYPLISSLLKHWPCTCDIFLDFGYARSCIPPVVSVFKGKTFTFTVSCFPVRSRLAVSSGQAGRLCQLCLPLTDSPLSVSLCVISFNSSLCLLACPFPEDSLSSETSVPSPGGTITLTIKRLLFCAVQTNQSDHVANLGPFIAFLSYVRTVVEAKRWGLWGIFFPHWLCEILGPACITLANRKRKR